MTNLGKERLRFPIMDKFTVSIQDPDGKLLTMEGGQDGIRPGKPISDPVPSGEKYVLKLPSHINWGSDDRLQLTVEDDYGSIWWIGPLKQGSHLVRMNYENQTKDKTSATDLWSGRAVIEPVRIQIITP